MSQRPSADEYAVYQEQYVALVPQEGELGEILRMQSVELFELLDSLSEEQGGYRYAPDKWSIKEVLGHLIDNERIASYRLLCCARGEQAALPGYEQNDYVKAGNFDRFTLAELVRQYRAVRFSTQLLVDSLEDEAWTSRGLFLGVGLSVRAVLAIIIGHERHHLNVLRERYLQG